MKNTITLRTILANTQLLTVLVINLSIMYSAATGAISVPAIIAIYLTQTVLIILFALLRLLFTLPKANRLYVVGGLLLFYSIFILYFWVFTPSVEPQDYSAILYGGIAFCVTYIASFVSNKKSTPNSNYLREINGKMILMFITIWIIFHMPNAPVLALLPKICVDIFTHSKKYFKL